MTDPRTKKAVDRARDAYDPKVRAVARFRSGIEDAPVGIENQPVSTISWVPASAVRANDYNPNFVAPPELRLLKVSILSDGWTQPLVVRRLDPPEGDHQYELVDGYHRSIMGLDPEVSALTGGLVPIVELRPVPEEHRKMSTIRHNRARGSHHVLKIADLVADLHERGIAREEIAKLLQMEDEEVERLLDRGSMVKRGGDDEFSNAWVPV